MKKPLISVVVPAYNEENHIGKLLSTLSEQDIKQPYEVIVVDGKSEDGTGKVVQSFKNKSLALRLLDNPDRITPVALNRGVEKSKGDFVLIIGAHSEVPPEFLRRNLEAMREEPSSTAVVGGRLESIKSDSRFVQAVEYVTSTFLGGGMSTHRYVRKKHYALTTVFGMYRKEVLEEVGLFDPTFRIGQDGELNLRIHKAGYKLLVDPKIVSYYHNRSTPAKLRKQMYNYGIARMRMVKDHGIRSIKHLIPLAILPGLLLSIILGTWWKAFYIVPAAYLAAIIGASMGKMKTFKENVLSYLTIHLLFGTGMWQEIITGTRRRK